MLFILFVALTLVHTGGSFQNILNNGFDLAYQILHMLFKYSMCMWTLYLCPFVDCHHRNDMHITNVLY